MMKLQKEEIAKRIESLYSALNGQNAHWDAAFIFDRVNQYYYTGTMQDGVFVLKSDGSYAYFVRRSFERARQESLIEPVYPMARYRDMLDFIGSEVHNLWLETKVVTYNMLERLKGCIDIKEIRAIDPVIAGLRAVKSEYELSMIRKSGAQHQYLMETVIPGLLREGMNEAELTAEIYEKMVALGYQGLSRFAMFQTEIVVGQLGFGENSIYPTSFDGPGGMKGMSPAVPLIGDRERKLKKGDLVFIDIGYGVNGYHSDRTQIYMFGTNPSDEIVACHGKCMNIQRKAASLLKPGNIPSDIYKEIMDDLDAPFLERFMGCGKDSVRFLGHGVGLQIDEYPVIAAGFHEPLKESMVIALEPKRSVEGVGIVGVEDTYVVTKEGGECITGGEKEIIVL